MTFEEIGVIFLMFNVGLEVGLKDFIAIGKTAVFVGILEVLIPLIMGLGTMLLLGHKIIESTSLGAAYMAGLKSGFWEDSRELERIRSIEKEFTPSMDEDTRHSLLAGWRKALRQATLSPLL